MIFNEGILHVFISMLTKLPKSHILLVKQHQWPMCRWEDNIRMDLEEIGISACNWVDSAQDRNY